MNKIILSISLLTLSFSSFSQKYYLGNKLNPTTNDFKLVAISSQTNVYTYKYVGEFVDKYFYGRQIGDIIVGIKNGIIVTTIYNLIPEKDDVGVPSTIIELIQKILPFPLAYKNGIYGVNIDNTSISISRTNNPLTFNKDRIMFMTSVKQSILSQDADKYKSNLFSSYTKEETERWLLEKFKLYARKRLFCSKEHFAILASPCTTYDDYEFKLDGTYLIVKCNVDNQYNEINFLPLYDFFYTSGETYGHELRISIKKFIPLDLNSFDLNSNSNDDRRLLTGSVIIGFQNDAEDDLVEKINQALLHLKTFYSAPKTSDLPEVSFESDLKKPSLEETKKWMESKLNSYGTSNFNMVVNSYGYKQVSNLSYSFSDFNLIIKYTSLNIGGTVIIPICECSFGSVSNSFLSNSENNFRFHSTKQNILDYNSYSGNYTNTDRAEITINFNKEDDLFERLMKAFKNFKSYCPRKTKEKEVF